jgi:hypothetical protein
MSQRAYPATNVQDARSGLNPPDEKVMIIHQAMLGVHLSIESDGRLVLQAIEMAVHFQQIPKAFLCG